MLRSENAKEKSKTEKGDRESVDEALRFDLGSQCQEPSSKDRKCKMGSKGR